MINPVFQQQHLISFTITQHQEKKLENLNIIEVILLANYFAVMETTQMCLVVVGELGGRLQAAYPIRN